MKGRLGYDDSLDVVGIHGLGGIVGTICLGIFASKLVNPGGADGLMAGNPGFWVTQIFGVVVVGIYAFALSWLLLKAFDMTMGLWLAMDSGESGLDLSEHSETAYS